MARAFISVGSNIDPAINVLSGLRKLAARVRISSISTVYLTEPLDRPDQPSYYNCVVRIETDLQPLRLKLDVLRRIEQDMGRIRTSDKSASRVIDLDLILYDDLVMNSPELTLPEPDILSRAFLAIPLSELEPEMVLPGSNVPVKKAAASLPGTAMQPLADYTDYMRKELLHG